MLPNDINSNIELISEGITQDSKFINQRRTNLKSDYIEITEDKLENILLKHLDKIQMRRSFYTPMSLAISTFATVLTATFSRKFGIDGPVWNAVFILAFIASTTWFIFSLILFFINRDTNSLGYLMKVIKDENDG